MLFQKHDFLLFTGDSVTDADRKRPWGEGLWGGVGNGYVRQIDTLLNAFYPELNLRITNTGNSGDTTRELRARWEQDVLQFCPDWLSICIGINDVWRKFDEPGLSDSAVSLENYRDNLEHMLSEARRKVKKGIILMTPYYMEPQKEDWMRKEMDLYGEVCASLAKKYETYFVDLQAVFDEYLQYRHSSYIAWDRVHPNDVGSLLIAKAFLSALGLPLTLGNSAIDK